MGLLNYNGNCNPTQSQLVHILDGTNYIMNFFRKDENPHDNSIELILVHQPIQFHIDQIFTIVKHKDPSMTIQTWEHIAEINLLLTKIDPWCSMSKVRFIVAKEQLESHILSTIYPLWITSDMTKDDQTFHMKVVSLSSLITLEFIGISLSRSRQPLIDNAINELSMMDCHPIQSPIQLLYHIHECCNSLFVALSGYILTDGCADGLVSMLVYVIVHTKPQHLISICRWIEEWSSPEENRSSELFCMHTNLCIAVSYICSLEPESSLINVDINNDNPPEIITQRLPIGEYLSILKTIKNSINELKELRERAKGVGIGATIGAVVASPIALFIGLMTTGLAIPFLLVL